MDRVMSIRNMLPRSAKQRLSISATATLVIAVVIIITSSITASDGLPGTRRRDVDLLARFVHAEAVGQPLVCRVAVASVVLNRINHPLFPKCLASVIFQQGAFRSVRLGTIYRPADRLSRLAAQLAVTGIDPSAGALKFWDPRRTVTRVKWQRNVTSVLGDYFFGD